MKKIKYVLLAQLITCSLVVNAQQVKNNDCECRFHAHDVVTITRNDEDPALIGQTGTILIDCNPAKYHLVNFPTKGGSWEILDDNMGFAKP